MSEMLLMAMQGARDVVKSQTLNMNNLANINTDGFRKEIALIQRGEDGYNRQVSAPDFDTGPLRSSGHALDVAIAGAGWIAIADPEGGEAYSRRGDLRVDELGQLRNGAGQQILGNSGAIVVPPHGSIEIGSDGTVSILPLGESPNTLAAIDRIKLVNPDTELLERGMDGLFRLPPGEIAPEDASLRLISGSLEGSNVNAVESLVRMIDLSRLFESQVKLMKLAEETQTQLAGTMSMN